MNFAQPFAQLKQWAKSLFNKPTPKPKPQKFEVHTSAPIDEPNKPRPTKAYADQRQKSPRRRKRKPSKAMRNLYQLN
jgi:hypothetical protein